MSQCALKYRCVNSELMAMFLSFSSCIARKKLKHLGNVKCLTPRLTAKWLQRPSSNAVKNTLESHRCVFCFKLSSRSCNTLKSHYQLLNRRIVSDFVMRCRVLASRWILTRKHPHRWCSSPTHFTEKCHFWLTRTKWSFPLNLFNSSLIG